ncbi:hypothetical protein BN135_3584 [Cronobacter muytjensii 530]
MAGGVVQRSGGRVFPEELSVLLNNGKTTGIKKPAESAGFEILAVVITERLR